VGGAEKRILPLEDEHTDSRGCLWGLTYYPSGRLQQGDPSAYIQVISVPGEPLYWRIEVSDDMQAKT